jgi:transcriptional regulator of acetoin/glycerol metabolism
MMIPPAVSSAAYPPPTSAPALAVAPFAAPSSPGIAVPPLAPVPPSAAPVPPRSLRELERDGIIAALHATGGNKAQAAALLEIDRSTLYKKLKDYGIEGT